MSVKFCNFVEVYLVSFQQITLKLGNFINLNFKALFPAESIDFSSPAHEKKKLKKKRGKVCYLLVFIDTWMTARVGHMNFNRQLSNV